MADSEVQWKSHRLKLIENTDGTYSIATAVGSGAPDQEVVGNVAHDAVDSGNPVKVGGVYRATTSTLTDGDRADLWMNSRGILGVVPVNATGTATQEGDNADSVAVTATFLVNKVNARGLVYNGSTYDRQRGDTTGTWVQGQGGVAHDAVDSGSPVKIGGKASALSGSVQPTVATGDRVDALFSHAGVQAVVLANSAGAISLANDNGDATAVSTGSLFQTGIDRLTVFNGTTWDRMRGDTTGAHVVPRATVVEVTATPTIDTAIFASGDILHSTIITFSGAVRANGGTGTIVGFSVFDYDLEQSPLELWLFSSSVTIPAANAAWSVSDADAANCLGVLPSGVYYASALNAVATANPVHPFKAGAGTTSIYGALVTRGTPTYTNATDIKVGLLIAQD